MGDWGMGIFQDDHAQDIADDIVEAENPSVFIDAFLNQFVSAARAGYDQSPHAGDWKKAREVLAVSEIVRLSVGGQNSVPFAVPRGVAAWLSAGSYVAASGSVKLAGQACALLRQSEWLNSDDSEMSTEVIAPLCAQLVTNAT